jgi:multidrug efflux system membrane fusion protein
MVSRALGVDVIAPDDKKTEVQGKLSFVDNTVDPTTGTIQLKGLFGNQDQKLWPGQFVDTYLTLSERPDAVLVPSQAVQTGNDGSYVFVVDPKMKAAIRTVAVGETIEGDTIIESGLHGGETVVTDGQMRLIPGGTVMIKTRTTRRSERLREYRGNFHPPSRDDDADLARDRHVRPDGVSISAG